MKGIYCHCIFIVYMHGENAYIRASNTFRKNILINSEERVRVFWPSAVETTPSATIKVQKDTLSCFESLCNFTGHDAFHLLTFRLCPAINCVAEWSQWDPCSVSCGTGTQGRTWVVTSAEQYGGTCEHLNGTADASQACNTEPCRMPPHS